mmetsp:Transcript_2392/g.4955  ORF Transcript_2392/g.4955 Transcript_2392/m.4955 type:complete len:354 (-) Transcript_2392:569-1630(-)
MYEGISFHICAGKKKQLSVMSFPEFVYTFYVHHYGSRDAAEVSLRDLVGSIRQYADESWRIRMFGRFLGLFDDGYVKGNLTFFDVPQPRREREVDRGSGGKSCLGGRVLEFFLQCIEVYVQKNSMDGSYLLPEREDFTVPLATAIKGVETLFNNHPLSHKLRISAAVRSIEGVVTLEEKSKEEEEEVEIAAVGQQKKKGEAAFVGEVQRQVKLDDLFSTLLEEWHKEMDHQRRLLVCCFRAADLNCNGLLEYEEFQRLVAYWRRDLSVEDIQRHYSALSRADILNERMFVDLVMSSGLLTVKSAMDVENEDATSSFIRLRKVWDQARPAVEQQVRFQLIILSIFSFPTAAAVN